MLTLLDKDGPYQLPTGWHEVTTRQFCEVDARRFETMEQRASYFAGRSIQVNKLVAEALFWMLKAPPTEGGFNYPADLGQETYLQVESIRSLLATQPLHQCFGLVYAAFKGRYDNWGSATFDQARSLVYAERCLEFAITDTYPAIAHCVAELARLDAKYAALAQPDTTEAGRRARQAGSDRLAVFSHMNVARFYAERFGVGITDIYQTSWETVAIWLLQDRVQAEINDNLQQQAQNDSK